MKKKKSHKYIFVIGGVMSGVGKGVACASIGRVLQDRGFETTLVKIDQYLNVDAGTMNPTEHGEVFVTKDGDETDQDIGNYERFLNRDIYSINYMTSGRVYQSVIERERNLGYGGKCVEAVPHIPEEVIRRIKLAAEKNRADITVIEIGGTIGEYQNVFFLEAARMMHRQAPEDVVFILVSYLPVPENLGEMKTKPTQQAARLLNAAGIQADFIIARSKHHVDKRRKEKLGIFCDVPEGNVISAPDVESIYDVPVNFENEQFGDKLIAELGLKKREGNGMKEWRAFVAETKKSKQEVKIAVIGKYFDTGDFVLSDAYISVIEAIKHSSYALGRKPVLTWLNSKDFEKDMIDVAALQEFDGVLVPGGFGETGIEGKIKVIKYARENKIPYFGLCYGMQLAVVEYARHVVGFPDANTTEINPKTGHPVIDIMPDQKKILADGKYGATMRLGSYPAQLKVGTIAFKAYTASKLGRYTLHDSRYTVSERHRHRFEVNPKYIEVLEKAGLVFSGVSPDGILMEIAELPRKVHPFFLGTQFHPEFQARPLAPHPLFTEFLKAAVEHSKKK